MQGINQNQRRHEYFVQFAGGGTGAKSAVCDCILFFLLFISYCCGRQTKLAARQLLEAHVNVPQRVV